eukprot:scaffold96158_cov18-Prasinocladus_malaysianus.AAC.1
MPEAEVLFAILFVLRCILACAERKVSYKDFPDCDLARLVDGSYESEREWTLAGLTLFHWQPLTFRNLLRVSANKKRRQQRRDVGVFIDKEVVEKTSDLDGRWVRETLGYSLPAEVTAESTFGLSISTERRLILVGFREKYKNVFAVYRRQHVGGYVVVIHGFGIGGFVNSLEASTPHDEKFYADNTSTG